MARSPHWRDEAASALVLEHLDVLEHSGPALVMEDPRDDVGRALEERGVAVARWHRRAIAGRAASPWPPDPDEPFASAFLRLPRAKEELEMDLHAAASVMEAGGEVLVYGAKDEGAGSAAKRMEEVFATVASVATGGRCRLVRGLRPRAVPGLKGSPAEWRRETPRPWPELPDRAWITYPGVFAAGRLDEGTRLLLERLPELPQLPGAASAPDASDRSAPREPEGAGGGAAFLDFGCGDGVVGGVLLARWPGARVDLLDVDALALLAARENVPDGRHVLGDGLSALEPPTTGYDAIVANPPYHAGKDETLDVVEGLVRGAPGLLRPGGWLCMVVQRRLPVDGLLRGSFRRVEIRGDEAAFRVWLAR